MKYITILILSLFLISCDNDSIAQESDNIIIKNTIPESFIGEYKHHLGEEVTGTISITDESIIINTSEVNYDIDITSSEVIVRPWCNDKILDITFIQCKKKVLLRINSNLNVSEHINYITLSKDYNVIGVFDPIIDKSPIQMN